MPAATPLPRGPSVLTLYSAADLLTRPGCPVCRYADEAADRYLGWFALEGHAQPGTISRLGASLGMCARHTRRIMSQPGAAVRLTAVYRYVLAAVRDRLAGTDVAIAACPACEHDDAAADRAIQTLLEGLADGAVAQRYRDLGGLCIPHAGIATAGGRRTAVTRIVDTVREALATVQARPDWLAGTDHDAPARAALRAGTPAGDAPLASTCAACAGAAQAERDGLAQLPVLTGGTAPAVHPASRLCQAHMADAAFAASRCGGLRALLGWQGDCVAAAADTATGNFVSRLRSGQRGPSHVSHCMVCREARAAGQRIIGEVRAAVRASASAADRPRPLCVRHHLIVRGADRRVGQLLAGAHAQHADLLASELTEAFRLTTWAHSQGAAAPVSSTWRQAAAFLDGGVLTGSALRHP